MARVYPAARLPDAHHPRPANRLHRLPPPQRPQLRHPRPRLLHLPRRKQTALPGRLHLAELSPVHLLLQLQRQLLPLLRMLEELQKRPQAVVPENGVQPARDEYTTVLQNKMLVE